MSAMNMQYEHENGETYALGCLPRRTALGESFPVYGPAEDMPLLDRTGIEAAVAAGRGDNSAGLRQILDQGNLGLCWAYSATQALMCDRVLKGMDYVALDVSICPIETGNSLNSGGAIEDALLKVQLVSGQPPAALVGSDPTKAKLNLRQSTWPANWKAEAAKYKVLNGKWADCADILAAASALIDGHPVIFGTDWQGGGHALCALVAGVVNGKIHLRGPNSWGTSWASGWGSWAGHPGWFDLSESQLGALGQFGCYALCGETYSDTNTAPAVV
jgi:hypothetical protein